MENVISVFICMLAFRFAVMCYWLPLHKNYFGLPSICVGIFAILWTVITEGISVTGNYNIGTVLGFFFLDIYLGLKVASKIR